MMVWVLKQLMSSGGLDANDIMISQKMVNMVKQIWDYFALLGIGFSIIYFLMEINRKYAFEATDLTIKTFAVPFIKLVASIGVLSKGGTIIGTLVELGNDFIQFSYSEFKPEQAVFNDLTASLNRIMGGMGFFVALILIIPCLACWIITVVCQLIWKYKALGFKIELLFRVGISPIALADVYSGQNSQAIRWCKSLLATVLYGASFILVYKLGHALVVEELKEKMEQFAKFSSIGDTIDAAWDMLTCMLSFLVIPIAEIGCISAIRTALKEALA